MGDDGCYKLELIFLDLITQVSAKDNKFTLLARAGRQVRFFLIQHMICFIFLRSFIILVSGLGWFGSN